MATRIVPEHRIFMCDRCKIENAPRNLGATIKMNRGGTDYQGNVVGFGGFSRELCDKCVYEVESKILKILTEV